MIKKVSDIDTEHIRCATVSYGYPEAPEILIVLSHELEALGSGDEFKELEACYVAACFVHQFRSDNLKENLSQLG